MSRVSFLAQLDSGILSIECFPLAYDLNNFKSRINRHVLDHVKLISGLVLPAHM